MNLDESDPTQCIVYASLTFGGGPLPSGHTFSAGDAKLFFADGTSANATNLPVALAGGATGLFKVQIARAQLQIRGDMLLQIASTTIDTWTAVIPVDHPQLYGDDTRLNNLTNLDAAVSSRAQASDIPSAAAIATQVDTTLTGTHGSGTWQQGNTTVPPAAAAIAAAVWDLARSGHQTTGTFGEFIDAHISAGGGGGGTVDTAAIAAAVWDLARTGHQTAGSFGQFIDEAISAAGGGAVVDTNAIATAVWNLARLGNQLSGTFGEFIDMAISQGAVTNASAVAAAVVAVLTASAAIQPTITGYSITQGDLEPAMTLRVTSGYAAVDLTTAVAVNLRWHKPDLSTSTVALAIANPLLGLVQRSWGTGDTAQIGTHSGQVVITWPGGRTETADLTYTWAVTAPI